MQLVFHILFHAYSKVSGGVGSGFLQKPYTVEIPLLVEGGD